MAAPDASPDHRSVSQSTSGWNIVFDFGAVLFNWRPGQLLMQTFPDVVQSRAQALPLAHQVFGHPDWHDFDRGVLAIDDVIARTATRLTLPHAQLSQLVYGVGEALTPMRETVSVLTKLRDRRDQARSDVAGLYYLSNMPIPYARTLEAKHDFLQWFDGGIFSGDVKHIKPKPEIYQLLQTRYALTPGRTVFVDDLKANVEAARQLGWHGIHFTRAEQLTVDLALLGL